MKNITQIISAWIFILFISGCNNKPSDALAKNSFARLLNEQSNGCLAVNNFGKVNGAAMEFMGQKMYTYEYNASIQFQKNCYKDENAFMGGPFTDFRCYEKRSSLMMNPERFFKDALVNISGELTFIKKENGWELDQNKPKNAQILSNINPLLGTWKLKESKINLFFEVDRLQVSENEIDFIEGGNPNPDRVRVNADYSGVYDFSGDAPPNTTVYRFMTDVSNDDKQLIFSVPGHGEATFVR